MLELFFDITSINEEHTLSDVTSKKAKNIHSLLFSNTNYNNNTTQSFGD